MKKYAELLAASKDERETMMKTAVERGIVILSERTVLQKDVAKTLVAMTNSGECESGGMRKHAMKITGHDIRETLQNVYELVAVFTALEKGEIELTEEEFDKLDTSKLALLSPFLTKPELKEKLGEAVEAAKTGTAKDIRNLKPKADKAADKAAEKPKGTEIPVGFMATDIASDAPLVSSGQFKARIKADLQRAMDSDGEEIIDDMKDFFGKAFLTACNILGEDPLDWLADILADKAKPAAGQTVETPALAVAV